MPRVDLFGGALAVSLSGDWLDASDLRPVPDHQEVWMERGGSNRALVIEMLELVDSPDAEAAAVHFEEISRSNGAAYSSVLSSAAEAGATPAALRGAGALLTLHGEQVLGDSTRLQARRWRLGW